ncbi:hypothetical protein [Vibrio sp. WXL103]|uniref:hypothetical protein n=1 Tax=Vibrio sp. WXL103 TaxID=3450710 RepID=UPI003EC5D04E
MPSTIHKFVTALLFLLAVGLCTLDKVYRNTNPLTQVNIGSTWEFTHRGYPSQFGYLSNLLDLRVVETRSQLYVDTERTIQALAFRLFSSEKMIGEFVIQFDIQWEMENNYIHVSVKEKKAQINYVSPGFDIDPFRAMLVDFIHDIYREPRELLSATNLELVSDIPYLGIVRIKRIPEPTLIKF